MKKKLIPRNLYGNVLLEMLPIYGTYKSALRFAENPSWRGAAETGLSLLGDVGTLFGVGALAKGISAASKANKASKAARIADKAAQTARSNYWDVAEKLGHKIKHNKDVVESLTLQPQKGSQLIITQRLKDNDLYKNTISSARVADKQATETMKHAHNKAYTLNKEAAETIQSSLLPGLSTVPFLAASTAISSTGPKPY